MTTIARLVGGAGTGKTTELLNILGQVLDRGVSPFEVGFCSFTRAARREASTRASTLTGIPAKTLETEGWFRTIHSVAYKALGVSSPEMIGRKSKADKKWLSDHLGCEVDAPDAEEILSRGSGQKTEAFQALEVWDSARNRLISLKAAHRLANASEMLPDFAYCVYIAERYEQAKRLDGRVDFTDLLGKVAGWRFEIDQPSQVTPDGDCPTLPVWIFDEQQDTNALSHDVCHRLAGGASWVYLAGDPFQAIYGFQGSHSKYFMTGWDVAKSKIMPRSYRCAKPIHDLGEEILRQSTDYWDRKIEPASHPGYIERITNFTREIDLPPIDPRESWLIIARTGIHVRRLMSAVKDLGIPWRPTDSDGGWARPRQVKALNALFDLSTGFPISGSEWQVILDYVPVIFNGQNLLVKKTKANWVREGPRRSKEISYVDDLTNWGATPRLIDLIKTTSQPYFKAGADFAAAYFEQRSKLGYEAVADPKVRIGTIHSAKGAEADNVIWLTTSTGLIEKCCADDDEYYNEECRIAYVAATRARKRLFIMEDKHPRYRFRFDI